MLLYKNSTGSELWYRWVLGIKPQTTWCWKATSFQKIQKWVFEVLCWTKGLSMQAFDLLKLKLYWCTEKHFYVPSSSFEQKQEWCCTVKEIHDGLYRDKLHCLQAPLSTRACLCAVNSVYDTLRLNLLVWLWGKQLTDWIVNICILATVRKSALLLSTKVKSWIVSKP